MSVTAIITTYNRPSVTRAVDSALPQVDECIVVDNGDETHITGEYHDDVTVIQNDVNSLSVSRNIGIEQASTDYVAFLDDDDRWHSDKIERQVEYMERHDYGACVAGETASTDPIDILCARSHCGAGSTLFVKTSLIDNIGGFDPDLAFRHEDLDLLFRLVRETDIGIVRETLADIGDPSIDAWHDELERKVMLLGKHYEYIDSLPFHERHKIYSYAALKIALTAFADGKFPTGIFLTLFAVAPPHPTGPLVTGWHVMTGVQAFIKRRW